MSARPDITISAPPQEEELIQVFSQVGAIQKGHFQLTSGRHSDTYIQCARVMESPRLTVELAEIALKKIPHDVLEKVDLVVSPAVGGITFGFAIAYALGKNFIFTERKESIMQLRRSFSIASGQRVLIAEDVVTTGGSVAEVEELVKKNGGSTIGVISLIDRMTAKKFTAPSWALLEYPAKSWEASECPLCAQGEIAQSLGSRTLA